jgi:acyl transferase domain-containing protein
MSARFSESDNFEQLWKHLAEGDDLVTEVSRWSLPVINQHGKAMCRSGSFLNGIAQFDPLFFNISGLEATCMDPQQRLFLEESWRALEDAGYAGVGVDAMQCGVYVGCAGSGYNRLIENSDFAEEPPAQAFWGNASSILAARITYYLNLHGPAVAIDTACSSSLVAIHTACQSLWSQEIDMALAGGVSIHVTPENYLSAGRAGMLSASGHCYTFDARADGFVPGEGIGVLVLKRLSDAVADGDHVRGVIRGSGINQDGATNGITAPSAKSQERLECDVYEKFGIDPADIQYIEAHGTGTELGDPIEFQALTNAFRKDTKEKNYCAIGSIKTNLGHTASAAGVAGVLKILLSLQYRQLPPSLHYESGNPAINFSDSPFYVNTELKKWEVEEGKKRLAAVSSFGFSGTNAHMVIEEAPMIERKVVEKPGYLVVLSACSEEQLRQQAKQLIECVENTPRPALGNISYTLLMGRKHFDYRLATVARSEQELIEYIRKWCEQATFSQVYTGCVKENRGREQVSLTSYGNQCIANCSSDIDGGDYIESLSVVADLYIQGYSLNYQKLHANDNCSRVPLPTYPFSQQSYWVKSNSHKKSPRENAQNFAAINMSTKSEETNFLNVLDAYLNDEIDVDEASKLIN